MKKIGVPILAVALFLICGYFIFQKDSGSEVKGKYGPKDIVINPENPEHSVQNVETKAEHMIRSDAALAMSNMREIHRSWLREKRATFKNLRSSLPKKFLGDPFNKAGPIQCFQVLNSPIVVLTSIGPDGDRDIFKENVIKTSSVPEMRRHLIDLTFDPTNGTISNGDIIRLFDITNPSDRQEY